MAKRREYELEGFSGINITPLMDLTFLLLIVFMITAPMLEYAVDVSPPQMTADAIDDPDNVLINLDAAGRIVYDNRHMSLDALRDALGELSETRPAAAVLIRADEQRAYGEIVQLMRTVKNAGLFNISLITQPED